MSQALAVWLASSALLLWPLALNGAPVLFFDSAGYLQTGQTVWSWLVRMDADSEVSRTVEVMGNSGPPDASFTSGRSLFYSVIAWGLTLGLGYWPVAVAQSGWIAAGLLLALRHLGITSVKMQIGIVAALSTLTPLAFFVCTIMPDVFGGMAILAVILLTFRLTHIKLAESAFWVCNLLLAVLFHRAFLLVTLAIAICLFVIGIWQKRACLLGWLLAMAVIIGGASLDVLTVQVAQAVSGKTAISPPFLIARGIEDGTVARVLREDCVNVALPRWVSCHFLPNLPLTANDVLWGPEGWNSMSETMRDQMVTEQLPLAVEAARRLPLMQLSVTAGNVATQLRDPSILEFTSPAIAAMVLNLAPDPVANSAYAQSALARGDFPAEVLSQIWKYAYWAAILGTFAMLLGFGVGPDGDTRLILLLLILSLFISAIVTASIAGPFGRYQARICWIAAFTFCATLALARQSTVANRLQE